MADAASPGGGDPGGAAACSICMESLGDDASSTALECGHRFHTGCILTWFRSEDSHGACPLCRAQPGMVLTFQDTMERCTLLRRRARARSAPAALRRAAGAVRRAEARQREVQAELRAFLTPEVRGVLRRHRRLRLLRWSAQRRVFRAKRQLGIGSFPGVDLPLVRLRQVRLRHAAPIPVRRRTQLAET